MYWMRDREISMHICTYVKNPFWMMRFLTILTFWSSSKTFLFCLRSDSNQILFIYCTTKEHNTWNSIGLPIFFLFFLYLKFLNKLWTIFPQMLCKHPHQQTFPHLLVALWFLAVCTERSLLINKKKKNQRLQFYEVTFCNQTSKEMNHK